METNAKKRLGASAALLFLSPALLGALSGCGNSNCDDDRSTLTTSDDCGVSRRRSGGGFVGGGSFGSGRSSARSGGFGGFGRMFSGGS